MKNKTQEELYDEDLIKRRRKLHAVYILIIINIIIYASAYITVRNFYSDYSALLIKVALKQTIQPVLAEALDKPLSPRDYAVSKAVDAGLKASDINCLLDHESGGIPTKWHVNNNGSLDIGLWQGNSINFKACDITCMLDYKQQTVWAINKIKHDGNYNAWFGYTSHCL